MMTNFKLVSELLPAITRILSFYGWFRYFPTNIKPTGLGEHKKKKRKSKSNELSKEPIIVLTPHLNSKP